ncbi:hypothetical protein [Nonomuraea typhae]|nr:hypothetical protein [Nonomuraea typhae]
MNSYLDTLLHGLIFGVTVAVIAGLLAPISVIVMNAYLRWKARR